MTASGRAVYELTGDSARHPKCTLGNGCFSFWPPLKVGSRKNPNKASRIRGKLGVWHATCSSRSTLAGHPLYRYAGTTSTMTTTTTSTTTTTTCLYPPYC